MTVPSTVSRSDFVGNGAASVYAYNYRILAETDLVVTVADLVDAETTLVLATDYTVSGVGDANGGNITLVNSGQAWLETDGDLITDYKITIRRVLPLTQTTDLRNGGPYFPNSVEDEFDRGIMIAQQRQDEVDRSLKLPETEAGSAAKTIIPSVANRASKVLAFDAAGNPIAQVNVPSGSVAATAYMETLLDDPDAATARATLGVLSVPNGILDGTIEEQAAPDATLRTIGLVIARDGIRAAVTNQNLTITANASGNPRVDMIEWNGNALSVKAGTAGASPVCPDPTAGSIPIAIVWVPDSFTTAHSFITATDTEAVIIAVYYAFSGMIAQKQSGTGQTITGADDDMDQIQLPLYFTHPGQGYDYTTILRLQNTNVAAKASLTTFHLLDGAKKGRLADETLTARDSGTSENVTMRHRQVGLLNGPITVGAHRITVQATRVINNVTVETQSLAVEQLR